MLPVRPLVTRVPLAWISKGHELILCRYRSEQEHADSQCRDRATLGGHDFIMSCCKHFEPPLHAVLTGSPAEAALTTSVMARGVLGAALDIVALVGT